MDKHDNNLSVNGVADLQGGATVGAGMTFIANGASTFNPNLPTRNI